MMMNTHKALAQQFINNVEEDKVFIINDGHFIWGNLKPDSVSKYKFKKHYIDESFEMIVKKIEFLSSLTLDDIYTRYSPNKFNQELGVVCHFLCDYFCIPHFQRWEFKSANAMKEHVLYENELNKFTKNYNIKKDINLHLTSEEIRKYIMKLQEEYNGKSSYEKDLIYASHICSTVVNMVLNEVVLNQKLKEHIALVI
ncbi:zinc dependent phospholipase C family protein [Clostridium sp. MB05]|jgi:Zinc dependent phospholipase C|uniref:zinc dependent phospholipase C family protein n=1 Tax=Clostridium sp. MB05 TaxID=3376682 RepID=UPI00398255C9